MRLSSFATEESPTLREAIRFCVVGGIAAGSYFGCTLLLKNYLVIQLTVAATLSFAIVATASYFLHYSWTFRSRRPHSSALPRFVVTSAGGTLINNIVLVLGMHVGITHQDVLLLLGLTSVVVWNFCLAKLWVFVDASAHRDDC